MGGRVWLKKWESGPKIAAKPPAMTNSAARHGRKNAFTIW